MTKLIIGIDPGAHGAVAVVNATSVMLFDLATVTLHDLADELQQYKIHHKLEAFLEKPPVMMQNAKSDIAKLHNSAGQIEGILIALGIAYQLVTPQSWQRFFGSPGAKLPYNERKKALKSKAQQLFPGVKVTNDTADALLIAKYGVGQCIKAAL